MFDNYVNDAFLTINYVHFSVVLIATASNSTTTILNKLLENVYNAMVLFVGVDEVKSHRNIERLKRELRVSRIDSIILLEQVTMIFVKFLCKKFKKLF